MRRYLLIILIIPFVLSGQIKYWNEHTQLTPWRLPLPIDKAKIEYIDLDGDGDPDILKTTIFNDIPVMWIDDDDNMKRGDLEGDQVNDCLLVDLNKDGIFGGPGDLSIKWTDTDRDGIANVQLIVQNGSFELKNAFDWNTNYMYVIDYGENDGIHNFTNWNELVLSAWEHSGHSNFYSDYHGNTLFLKTHASSFRINNLNYNWENPFIFYDPDKDGLSEMSIRMVDMPNFKASSDTIYRKFNIDFSKKISWAGVSWDLDNDNGQGNEFDFDMTIRFVGEGFDYSDQIHTFKNMKGLVAADKYIFDSRWRHVDTLVYTDPKIAYSKIFKKGKWKECWMTFDEDDDCNRWERVELYEPKDIWEIGRTKGGVDNNNQADATGDRGEFDADNSGGGKLYISTFDGRLHLYGAEWGIWRIDMNASCFQGYGGLYPPSNKFERLGQEPSKCATVRYTDTNNNGFIDLIEYDLDGDQKFEERISLLDLGIDDRAPLIETGNKSYRDMNRNFLMLTDKIWNRSQSVLKIAKKQGVSSNWYAFWKQPHTVFERYQYGYWLIFYLYKDMSHKALLEGNTILKEQLDKAYYSGKWTGF